MGRPVRLQEIGAVLHDVGELVKGLRGAGRPLTGAELATVARSAGLLSQARRELDELRRRLTGKADEVNRLRSVVARAAAVVRWAAAQPCPRFPASCEGPCGPCDAAAWLGRQAAAAGGKAAGGGRRG